jgi:sugar phosphate isomerase/epimerase
MNEKNPISRRSILAWAATPPMASVAALDKEIPVGLELASVRNDLARDPLGTVRAVAKMGYQSVEFWMPYYWWTLGFAREVKKLLDDLGISCSSTLNDATFFSSGKLQYAIELNQALGSKLLVITDPEVDSMDGWKRLADVLNKAAEKLQPLGMRAGYHNHEAEFTPLAGRRPIDVLAANTGKNVVLQLDTGACLQGGGDPVAFIEQNPGRIASMHCKDWIPAPWPKCYFVFFGKGQAPLKKIFQAAEKTGGIENYLIEQGQAPPLTPMEAVQQFLIVFRKLHDT